MPFELMTERDGKRWVELVFAALKPDVCQYYALNCNN
jgi:hypothetical protein